MSILEFDEAVKEIAETCREAKRRKRASPFVFVVGAGISHPPVPLASQIEEDCRERAMQRGVATAPTDSSPMGRYSYWFGKAYPHPEQRREYLQSLVEGQPISAANLGLAHLLLDNSVTNLVITPNFDDLLFRALNLMGHHRFRICDHPGTVDRIDVMSEETQIVHVHGTYWFYDQANLAGEIDARAQRSSHTAFTMASLLEDIFRKRSPIVVGYSGWEKDVIMTALKRRLAGRLGYRMYWFCHRRDARPKFPEDLDRLEDVCFALPPKRQETAAPQQAGLIPIDSKDPREGVGRSSLPIESQLDTQAAGREKEEVLEADRVFKALIRELGLEAPELLRDPLGFFARQFEEAMPKEVSESEGTVYSFRSVLRRIKTGQECEQSRQPEKLSVQKVYEAVARSAFNEAIKASLKVGVESLGIEDKRELVQSLWAAVTNLERGSEDAAAGTDMIVRVTDSLPEPLREADMVTLARALVNKGVTLGQLGRNEVAVGVCDEVVKRFGEATELTLREQVARALFNKGVTLGQWGHNEEAVGAFEEVVKRFGEATEPVLREGVGRALVNKGNRLAQLGRDEEAVGVYEEVVKRFREATEPALREQVARALVNKGNRLAQLGRNEEAVGVCDEVVKRFGEATEPALREQVAGALINKGVTLGQLGRNEEAVGAYEKVVERLGEATEPALREQVGRALVNKGNRLAQLGRDEEAVEVYEEVVKRFREATEPVLREGVGRALVNKGNRLAQLGRNDEAVGAYEEVVKRFGETSEPALAKIVRAARELAASSNSIRTPELPEAKPENM